MNTNRPHSLTDAMQDIQVRGRHGVCATGIDRRMQRFDAAIRLMEEGRWEQAFTRLAELADAEHPEAARVALMLVRHGSRLFGGTFLANASQRQSWQRAGDL